MKEVEQRRPKFVEVFLELRITEEAVKLGYPSGAAYDIKNGFDFRIKADQARCWRKLEQLDPDVVVVCPPCDPFCQLQE